MSDVKNFSPMDLPLLRRVAARGINLDVAASIENANPLETALLHIVGLRGRGRPTYILRADHQEYAAQMRLDDHHARITLLAPAPPRESYTGPWVSLLEALIRHAGQRGAYVVAAEVPLDDHYATFDLFRQAGFSVYSRASLYVLDSPKPADYSPDENLGLYLRPMEEDDDARLNTLYASTVPPLAQQVISSPGQAWEGLAVIYNQRLWGGLVMHSGKHGLLLQPYLHPELYDLTSQIMGLALAMLPPQKIYIRLHAFQEWMRVPLAEDWGFVEQGRYALMARHTVVKRESQHFLPRVVLENAFSPIEVALECRDFANNVMKDPLHFKTKSPWKLPPSN